MWRPTFTKEIIEASETRKEIQLKETITKIRKENFQKKKKKKEKMNDNESIPWKFCELSIQD